MTELEQKILFSLDEIKNLNQLNFPLTAYITKIKLIYNNQKYALVTGHDMPIFKINLETKKITYKTSEIYNVTSSSNDLRFLYIYDYKRKQAILFNQKLKKICVLGTALTRGVLKMKGGILCYNNNKINIYGQSNAIKKISLKWFDNIDFSSKNKFQNTLKKLMMCEKSKGTFGMYFFLGIGYLHCIKRRVVCKVKTSELFKKEISKVDLSYFDKDSRKLLLIYSKKFGKKNENIENPKEFYVIDIYRFDYNKDKRTEILKMNRFDSDFSTSFIPISIKNLNCFQKKILLGEKRPRFLCFSQKKAFFSINNSEEIEYFFINRGLEIERMKRIEFNKFWENYKITSYHRSDKEICCFLILQETGIVYFNKFTVEEVFGKSLEFNYY